MSTIEDAFKKLNKKEAEKELTNENAEVSSEDLARIEEEYSADLDPKEFWQSDYSAPSENSSASIKNEEVYLDAETGSGVKEELPETEVAYELEEKEVAADSTSNNIWDGVKESDGIVDPKAGESTKENVSGAISFLELNFEELNEKSILIPNSDNKTLIEEYRAVKRPLIKNAIAEGPTQIKHGNIIMVTSALPGEGKTYSSINLAMSIAMEFDRTVLLIDADVAKPSFPEMLGIPENQPGLTDLLDSEKLDLSDVLLRTNIENLAVLPSGSHHELSTELLASEGMRALTEELSTRYSDRIVVFDSPPLLLTSEASVLASIMGQIVLVVEANFTSQQAVKDALLTIEESDVVSLLLNKSKGKNSGSYYGGYGGYSRNYQK